MRKIVVSNMVTLDGFIAGTHGEIDWHMVDDDFMTEQLITEPPKRCIADSKDKRVRVLGS